LDAPLRVRVVGLRPRERITLVASEKSRAGRRARATAAVHANVRGVVDIRHSLLLAKLRPLAGGSGAYFPDDDAVLTVRAVAGARTLATVTAERVVRLPSVDVEDLRPAQTGLSGQFFDPHASTPRPAVVVIGGSLGGLTSHYAPALLASHGYPVLLLAYFGEPGLPAELHDIPLEY